MKLAAAEPSSADSHESELQSRHAGNAWQVSVSPRELAVLVYKQMRVFAGPHRDLDDLAQTALEQVLRAKYEPHTSLSSFTYVVCYRVWLKHLRWSYRFRLRFSFNAGTEEDVSATEHRTPGSVLEDAEKLQRLYAALDGVSPKRRAVLALYYLSGLEVPEIATIVDANEATVRSRLRDGRVVLRQLLSRDDYFAGYFAPSTEAHVELQEPNAASSATDPTAAMENS